MSRVLALHPSLAHGGIFAGLGLAGITAPDMIGHGRAPDWDGRGDFHDAATRDANAQAEAMAQSDPIDLIGHSFGATVALRIALERPELLRSIVLIEPVLFAAARADEAPEYKGFLADHAAFVDLLRSNDLPNAARHFQRIWGDGRDFLDAPQVLQDYIIARLPLVAAQTASLHSDNAGIMGYLRLESLGLPVLMIRGGDSPPIIAAIARALTARLPNVQTAVIGGARHMVPLTHPALTAAAIRDFWAGLRP